LIFATRGAAAEPVPEALLVLADLDKTCKLQK